IGFTEDKTLAWYARFDTHESPLDLSAPTLAPSTETARVEANHTCPQSGYWYTPAKQNSRALFKQGELMPDFPTSTYGATIWYWGANQE
ncbi:hypothetical protein R6242_22230, partial [Iodobacter sp. CM08]|uniref:hypothetical protein n=1 Tax=Iodobacter sp. CM08 TaxID=3085902 RepID=UPI00298291FA